MARKWLPVFLALAVVLWSGAAYAADAQNADGFKVTLTDGSMVNGAVSFTINLDTPYGKIVIPSANVVSVKFDTEQKLADIELTDSQMKLKYDPAASDLKATTSVGPLNIGLTNVTLVAKSAPAPAKVAKAPAPNPAPSPSAPQGQPVAPPPAVTYAPQQSPAAPPAVTYAPQQPAAGPPVVAYPNTYQYPYPYVYRYPYQYQYAPPYAPPPPVTYYSYPSYYSYPYSYSYAPYYRPGPYVGWPHFGVGIGIGPRFGFGFRGWGFGIRIR